MASQGPNSPNAAASGTISSSGSAWDNPNNAKVEDGSFSTTGTAWGDGDQCATLDTNDFGFTIPSGATIDGVTVEAKIQMNPNMPDPGGEWDMFVNICNNTTIMGSGKTDVATGTLTYHTYGGAADVWGASLTDTIINSSNFRISIRTQYISGLGGPGTGTVNVDHVRVTINYTGGASGGGVQSLIARVRNGNHLINGGIAA